MTDEEIEKIGMRIRDIATVSMEVFAEGFAKIVNGEKRVVVVPFVYKGNRQGWEVVLLDPEPVYLEPAEGSGEIKDLLMLVKQKFGTATARDIIWNALGSQQGKLDELLTRPDAWPVARELCQKMLPDWRPTEAEIESLG